MLDRIGEAELEDVVSSGERVVTVSAWAPMDQPYVSARFEYTELYRRVGDEWEMTAYTYEFQQRPPPGRRAYHWHEPWAYHFHCVDPSSADNAAHYRGYEVDVFEAHRAFLRLYAEGRIDCSELHPLRR